jgi:hypothetical protein
VRSGQVGGSETMYVRAFDGTDWGGWDAQTEKVKTISKREWNNSKREWNKMKIQ